MNAHIMSSNTNTDKDAKLVQNSKDNKENLAEIPKAEKESCAANTSANNTAVSNSTTAASSLVTAGNGAGVGANTD